MKLIDARDAYYRHSTAASGVARQASFAGIALIWIFKSQYSDGLVLPNDLLMPILFFVASLSFDLLQYISATAIWGVFHRFNEWKLGADFEGDLGAHPVLNWPAVIFFWGKMVAVVIGYISLASYILAVIQFK